MKFESVMIQSRKNRTKVITELLNCPSDRTWIEPWSTCAKATIYASDTASRATVAQKEQTPKPELKMKQTNNNPFGNGKNKSLYENRPSINRYTRIDRQLIGERLKNQTKTTTGVSSSKTWITLVLRNQTHDYPSIPQVQIVPPKNPYSTSFLNHPQVPLRMAINHQIKKK